MMDDGFDAECGQKGGIKDDFYVFGISNWTGRAVINQYGEDFRRSGFVVVKSAPHTKCILTH